MAKTKRTTTEAGLGWEHQQNRTRLLQRHRDGTKCWWCNRPMFKAKKANFDRQALDADHSKARANGGTKADRLLHGSCNRSRGKGDRDHQRPSAPAPAHDAAPLTTRQWW